MTTREFPRFIIDFGDKNPKETIDEKAVKEIAQLISGSLIYRLYEAACTNDYDLSIITSHLEMLYDSENHYGLIYFIFMLADSTDTELPERFDEFAVTAALVPYLSAALMEDWLDYNEDYVFD